jgi:hypothetical protein
MRSCTVLHACNAASRVRGAQLRPQGVVDMRVVQMESTLAVGRPSGRASLQEGALVAPSSLLLVVGATAKPAKYEHE